MDADEEYTRILRAMTPTQKVDAAFGLYWGARELKAAWLRSIHPDWTEERVQREVYEIFRYARD